MVISTCSTMLEGATTDPCRREDRREIAGATLFPSVNFREPLPMRYGGGLWSFFVAITQMPIDDEVEQRPDIVELSRKAIAALSEEREMLFVQGNRLVDVDLGDGKITVERVNRQRLIYHMRRCLDWDNKQLGIVASDLMQHKSFKTFRRLEGTYTAPTFRSDFTLIRPGYDESTESLYMPPADLKDHRFNHRATQADARNAYARLLYPFSDFPFKSDATR